MESSAPRKPYSSDVTDEEWAFVAPYLTLMTPDAPQRKYDLRAVYNALRSVLRTGAQWRYLPHEYPPWEAVYQQMQRWLAAGVFETMVPDLRVLLRWLRGRADAPTATILDSRTLQSTSESGHRAGYDGYKRRKGSKIHAAVDTLGELLALIVTAASALARAQVRELAAAVQAATGDHVELAFVDQGYIGGRSRGRARDRADGREGARGQARFRAAAATLGGRARCRLGEPVPATGARFRTAAGNGGRPALRGVPLPDAPSTAYPRRPRSLTGSSVLSEELGERQWTHADARSTG